jgi:hypothetical protein
MALAATYKGSGRFAHVGSRGRGIDDHGGGWGVVVGDVVRMELLVTEVDVAAGLGG